jgi:hypothetical protein
MLTNKVISADEAIALIGEGDVVTTTGTPHWRSATSKQVRRAT